MAQMMVVEESELYVMEMKNMLRITLTGQCLKNNYLENKGNRETVK